MQKLYTSDYARRIDYIKDRKKLNLSATITDDTEVNLGYPFLPHMYQDYGIKESKLINTDIPYSPNEYKEILENQKNENILKKIKSLNSKQNIEKQILSKDNTQMHKSILDY